MILLVGINLRPTISKKDQETWIFYHRSMNKETASPSKSSDDLFLEIGPRLEGHLPRFSAIQTHLSCRLHLAVDFPGLGRSGSRSQIIDQAQDFPKQVPGRDNLGKPERDVPTVPHHLGADFDRLLAQHGSPP